MIRKIMVWAGVVMLGACLCSAEVWKAPDQEKAKERAKELVPFVDAVKDDCKVLRRVCLLDKGIDIKDVETTYFHLESPIIKAREDHYGPVRFAHKRHAALIGDCTACHHYRPKDESMSETTRCSACHQEAFKADNPQRLGLKAAFHQQCMACHKQEAKGPVNCTGCHLKNVPDHKELVKLPDDADPFQVTAECRRCHDAQAEDMLTTAHWLWKGPSPFTVKHRKDIQHGKGTTALNNY
ncbi:Class III cytochrome C family protein [Desulfocicer vacuolatum DSM 3385]|uniref:Class III cytochrome C family protein n=1 Tax=Desulfocicer vacuolatum DSM 3385 TaxID=1121400 RepID=A0A1W2DFD4_9BACT|nr:Class III cytochrome C family protein [Desulfocicer vacuolatum DSM 3385]